jgi:hypothetical protein
MQLIKVVALHALIAYASEDALVDRLAGELVHIDQIDLDETTLGAAVSPMAKVNAIQSKLKAFGVPSTPFQELALTAMVGERDIRAKAQIPKVFDAMDSESKQRVTSVTKQVVTRAYKDVAAINLGTKEAKEMAGVSPPLGFWDPFGFTSKINGLTLLYLKEAEIKHGRVCMLAFLGIYVGEKYHPFLGGNIDLPAAQVKAMFLNTPFVDFFMLGFVGILGLEALSVRTQYDDPYWEFGNWGNNDMLGETSFYSTQLSKQPRLPGELGFDPLGLKPKDADELKTIQTKEINNGRLAMLAVVGILMQELATQVKTFD